MFRVAVFNVRFVGSGIRGREFAARVGLEGV